MFGFGKKTEAKATPKLKAYTVIMSANGTTPFFFTTDSESLAVTKYNAAQKMTAYSNGATLRIDCKVSGGIVKSTVAH
jgi:hypothetical protein